jgi:hypothetical protein
VKAIAPFLLASACLLTACTYDSVRMNERHRCAEMPETLAKDCFSRTEDSRKEFEAKRRALEESVKKGETQPPDARYERWIP